MKKVTITIASLMLLILLSFNLYQENSNPTVTFIELGSVKCIPCQKMQLVMKKVEEKYPNEVKVIFYDVWTKEEKKYAEQYKINSIPTQIFLDKNGKEYYRHVGYFPYEELEKVIKQKVNN